MKLLVIIVTYNAMHWAKRCFDSITASSIVPDVFVVDNGSTDGTQAYIHENYPSVIFQQSKENLGFGAANNIGLKYALDNNYDYVYLLNQDAWVLPDTFERLIKISVENPDFGLISPMQMNADLYHIDKNFCNGLFDYQNKEFINDLYNGNLKEIYETTPFIMAAHWFLTKECIKRVGGFSPTFTHYGEDGNYAHRIVYHGLKTGVAPQQKVVHDRGERIDAPKKMMYLRYTELMVTMSSPGTNKGKVLKQFANAAADVLRFKSLLPLVYFIKLMLNFVKITKYKNVSMKTECAFLREYKVNFTGG